MKNRKMMISLDIVVVSVLFVKMCGDIMITTKNKNKTSSTSMLVVSIMCAVIMTIVRQSIHHKTDIYAWDSYNDLPMSHGVASDTLSEDSMWMHFANILESINALIIQQKQVVDNYIVWDNFPEWWQNIVTSQPLVVWTSAIAEPEPIIEQSEYLLFEDIKKALSDKYCEYNLPVDNTDPKLAPHIQWWLDHCLITVSAAQKVYPNDILTHEMMRTIAERAGFVVKMDYASTKPVSRDQFLTFFYALQQHHKIWDLPVISMSNPLRRWEYIRLLHMIFGDSGWHTEVVVQTWNVKFDTVWTWVLWSPSMTVKEFKEIMIADWKNITITPYDDTIMMTPEIMKKILNDEKTISTLPQDKSIGIDKEMLKQTVSWMMEKL